MQIRYLPDEGIARGMAQHMVHTTLYMLPCTSHAHTMQHMVWSREDMSSLHDNLCHTHVHTATFWYTSGGMVDAFE